MNRFLAYLKGQAPSKERKKTEKERCLRFYQMLGELDELTKLFEANAKSDTGPIIKGKLANGYEVCAFYEEGSPEPYALRLLNPDEEKGK